MAEHFYGNSPQLESRAKSLTQSAKGLIYQAIAALKLLPPASANHSRNRIEMQRLTLAMTVLCTPSELASGGECLGPRHASIRQDEIDRMFGDARQSIDGFLRDCGQEQLPDEFAEKY